MGGALRFAAPQYAMVGVPVTMYAYASWRPDANSPAQPTNGTAVIRVDGEDYSGVEFKDGVAEWRFIPETEGMKEFTASGVVFSGLSGANAYIDTVEARTYVLEYDPAAYEEALKKKRVEVGDTYVITDPNQARSYLEDRYEWSVSEKSDDVCAVYETKKGAVKAKFNGEGKCTVPLAGQRVRRRRQVLVHCEEVTKVPGPPAGERAGRESPERSSYTPRRDGRFGLCASPEACTQVPLVEASTRVEFRR